MKRFLIVFIAVIIWSCSKNDDPNPQEVYIESISKGVLYGTEGEDRLANSYIISNQEQWEKFLNKINSVNKNIEEEAIDFSEFMVLGVVDTLRGYNGYSVEISKVLKKENNLEVITKYDNIMGISPVENQPYHVVRIPKSNLDIIFKRD